MMSKIWCIALGCLLYWPVQAGLYRCVDNNGVVEFRDRACATSEHEEVFLPVSFTKTDPKKVHKQEIQRKMMAKKEDVVHQKLERKRKSLDKKNADEKAKAERRRLRCQNIDEKIKTIEDQLRRGCKEKRFQRLKEELEECHKRKIRYCH